MANTATSHLIERNRRGILWDVAVCASCLAEHVRCIPGDDDADIREGFSRRVTPMADSRRECSFCVADEFAEDASDEVPQSAIDQAARDDENRPMGWKEPWGGRTEW